MFADYLYVITDSLRGHNSRYNEQISDRMLDDIGLTRAEFIKQTRRSSRKSAAR